MKPWINRAKETLSEVIDSVVQESKEEGENPLIVRVCFIGFRDHKDDERFSVCPFTEDVQTVKDFMNNCIAEGGKDIPEDVVGGLKMCLLQDWTSDSIKKVFMIGDAPCHGKKYTGDLDDHYPSVSPEGLTIEDLMKEYCKLDIEFSIIKLNNSVDAMIEAMRMNHQELDVKDMSDQAVEKAMADHIIKFDPKGTPAARGGGYHGPSLGMFSGKGGFGGGSSMAPPRAAYRGCSGEVGMCAMAAASSDDRNMGDLLARLEDLGAESSSAPKMMNSELKDDNPPGR